MWKMWMERPSETPPYVLQRYYVSETFKSFFVGNIYLVPIGIIIADDEPYEKNIFNCYNFIKFDLLCDKFYQIKILDQI